MKRTHQCQRIQNVNQGGQNLSVTVWGQKSSDWTKGDNKWYKVIYKLKTDAKKSLEKDFQNL